MNYPYLSSMRKIDLHTHTTASDGIYTPRGLIDLARQNGLIALAITDHDTVDGLPEAMEYASSVGFRVFPGVEFSIEYDTGSFHLIGFNLDFKNQRLRNTVRELAEHRGARAYRIIDDLKKHGIDLPVEEVLAAAAGGAMGRPHVARVMVNHGYAPTIRDIFQKYLVKGKPGYVKKVRIEFEDAVSVIKESGGIPVIAHPVSLECADLGEFESLLKGFVAAGVEGLEAYASMHTPEMAAEYLALAKKYGLLVTGGSDFHGDKDETIGNYNKDCPVPFELLDALDAYIAKKG
ncbi:MAG: PHP domain-containing protein [Spirochaetes bacterium]|nr:PHP domain-containing protein [Spirochaetota bacterium]